MTCNFTSHVPEYVLFGWSEGFFIVRIDDGYVNFLFLVISRRVSLTDSFWSCFCCSSRAFSFNVAQPSFSQTLALFLVLTHSVSAQFDSRHLLAQLGDLFGVFGLMEGSPESIVLLSYINDYRHDQHRDCICILNTIALSTVLNVLS